MLSISAFCNLSTLRMGLFATKKKDGLEVVLSPFGSGIYEASSMAMQMSLMNRLRPVRIRLS